MTELLSNDKPTPAALDCRHNQCDAPAIVQRSDEMNYQVAKNDAAFSEL